MKRFASEKFGKHRSNDDISSSVSGGRRLPTSKVNQLRSMMGGVVNSQSRKTTAQLIDDAELDDSTEYADMLSARSDKDLLSVPSTSVFSPAARSHTLQRVRIPAKCGHCDTYTFFMTVQCQECGMSWHKGCLQAVEVHCGPGAKTLASVPRRMSIFGVSLSQSCTQGDDHNPVPMIIRKCVIELEKRGARTKGIYRVCGVKSKIEQLCEQFERETPDLTTESPTNIASVVKLYLRQLPEPLLTASLYDEWIKFAKQFPAEHEQSIMTEDEKQYLRNAVVSSSKELISKLPDTNQQTLEFLLLHLRRLTWFEADNGMSSTNMGIVFGPTLLWRDLTDTPLDSLLEAPLQARAIDLMIRHVYDIFELDASEDRDKFINTYGPAYGLGGRNSNHHADQQIDGCSSSNERLTVGRPRQSATPDLLKTHQEPKIPAHHTTSSETADDLSLNEGSSLGSSTGVRDVPDDVMLSTENKHRAVQRHLSSPAGSQSGSSNITSSPASSPNRNQRRLFSPGKAKSRSYTTSILISPDTRRRHIILPSDKLGSERTTDCDTSTGDDENYPQSDVNVEPQRGQLVYNPESASKLNSNRHRQNTVISVKANVENSPVLSTENRLKHTGGGSLNEKRILTNSAEISPEKNSKNSTENSENSTPTTGQNATSKVLIESVGLLFSSDPQDSSYI